MNPQCSTPPPVSHFASLVSGVFLRWNEAGIPFVVLRNYQQLPQATSHDVDVLIDPRQVDQAERLLLEAASAAGFHLSNRAQFSPVSLFLFHPETLAQAQFDLFHTLNWRGITLLPARVVLNWRLDRGLFAIPHPVHESINNLTGRLIYHGYVKDAYKEFIHSAFQHYPQETETKLRRMAGKKVGARIARAILERNWTGVEAQTKALRRGLVLQRLIHRPFEITRQILGDARRLWGRVRRPPGITLVLLGPDGSGKSSVAEQLLNALHGTFYKDKSLHVHWKPKVFLRRRRDERAPTANPHGQKPRGWLASQAALLFHWTEYLAGQLIQFGPVLFRSGMVLIERHHYDFEVDPLRYRLQPPCSVLKLAFRRLPQPDLVFLLDAPVQVLQSRKPEVTPEECQRQRDAYRAVIAQLPNAHLVNCTQSIDAVVRTILGETLRYLERRQLQRSGSDGQHSSTQEVASQSTQ